MSFVDDINILAFGNSIEENCRTLKRVHRICEKWAKTHEVDFAPAEYELIHLVRNPKRLNMTVSININNNNI